MAQRNFWLKDDGKCSSRLRDIAIWRFAFARVVNDKSNIEPLIGADVNICRDVVRDGY